MLLENIIISVAIFISYFLQTSVEFLRLGGIKPDFLLILASYFALYRGSFVGLWVGFLGGLLQDINLGGVVQSGISVYYIGTNALPKALAGYYTGKISPKIHKENSLIIFILIFLLSLAKGILTFFEITIFHETTSATSLATIVLPESLYTAIIAMPWFKLLRWAIPPNTRGGTT